MAEPVDPIITNLPLSDPACIRAAEACTAFYAAANASQAAVPWVGQIAYGRWLTYYWVCLLCVFVLAHLFKLWHQRRQLRRAASSGPSAYTRLLATGRWVFYRRVTIWPLTLLGLPSAGVLTVLMTSIIVVTGMTFAARPYYREQFGFGSPPIAIRTGVMAYACVPLLVALAGKANIVTMVTGFSHEKLNVFHQWVAWVSFVLSWIHTIPFFVASLRMGWARGQSGYAAVVSEFYRSANPSEYTGVPALAMLCGLCAFSVPWIRHRYYETFYWLHIPMAVTYLGLLFWHAYDLEDTWVYLWATVAIWLASWTARVPWFTRPLNFRSKHWFLGSEASMTPLPGEMTRIEVAPPSSFTWSPGQHVLLRFPKVNIFDNHPFTITSAPHHGDGKLVFLARTHAGFTKRLGSYSAGPKAGLARAWVDGPYGGVGVPVHALFDNVVCMAGGTGITPCLGMLADILSRSGACRVKTLKFVWVFRELRHFVWAVDRFRRVSVEGVAIDFRFFVTGDRSVGSASGMACDEKRAGEVEAAAATVAESTSAQIEEIGELAAGRPQLATLLPDLLTEGKNFVLGCGPQSFRDDLAQSCAAVQARAMRGAVEEIALHTEALGW